MKQVLTIIVVIFTVITLIAAAFTLNQVNQESARLENDIQYRSSLLADGLKESVEPNFINKSDVYLQSLVERYANRQRIAGLAVVDNKGNIVAVSSSLPKEISQPQLIATNVMDADKADGDFVTYNGKKLYIYAQPLHDNKSVVGALLVVQNASYIDSRLFDIWTGNALRIVAQALLISIAVLLFFRWLIYTPIQKLAESLQQQRLSKNKKNPLIFSNPLFRPILEEVSHIQQNLMQARLAASEEAKASLEKLDSPWTAERLKQFVKDILKGRKIIVVSNREPYIHTKNGNKISYYSPASGMVTAIEPVMEATGGVWVANGTGDADKLVVDKDDTIQVPPQEPKYTLKRVWLTEQEENGYYVGFSNECLWPLTHSAHVRPIFRQEDWEQYKVVNEKFARTVLEEIKDIKKPVILIQDFHPALVPKIIKAKRPDATIGIFWHEPWVSAESFSIFPWKKELLDGMLGADLIGFHTQLHCNNFIETVGRELESLIDYELYTVTRGGHASIVKPFPISIAFSNGQTSHPPSEDEEKKKKELLSKLGITTKYIGIGVERLDYIKGILERLKAIEIFLRNNPEYQGEFTFIQIAAPSRDKVKRYQEFSQEVEKEVERINELYKKKNWKPILLLKKHHSHEELNTFYKIANVCFVTSLHDGMNLVAKEFIASRNDEKGVLILSQFAGASRDLKDALIVNPYNADISAEIILTALTMSLAEQTKRMRKLRTAVRNYNIYRWSAEFLKVLTSME